MPKPESVGEICASLAELAQAHGMQSLSMWLKLATSDAYMHNLMTEARSDQRIGIFDWDIGNDLDYVNAVGANFFGKTPEAAAAGLPVGDYLAAVHPLDRPVLARALEQAAQHGGAFGLDYRVIAQDTVRWLRADGSCTLDNSGRPMRLMGSLLDVSAEKQPENVVYLRGY
jgi:PAS domain-containing protein